MLDTTPDETAGRDLILRTALPLKAVAAQTGFADEAHMSHVFRRLTGRPPGSLRMRPLRDPPPGAGQGSAREISAHPPDRRSCARHARLRGPGQ